MFANQAFLTNDAHEFYKNRKIVNFIQCKMSFRMTCAFFCICVKKNQLQTYRWMKSVCERYGEQKANCKLDRYFALCWYIG